MRQYSTHKRFVSDVTRIVNRETNIDKVVTFAMNYLALRQVHPREIDNEQIAYLVRRITDFDSMEIPDIYQELIDSLTNQQFIFRIKRVKYVKNTRESVMIVPSPLLASLGNNLMSENISMMNIGVKLLNEKDPVLSETQELEKNADKSRTDQEVEPEYSSIDYLILVWNDPKKRLQWFLDNMNYTSTKYNYSHPSGYTPEEVSKAMGKDIKSVLHYIRRYLAQNNSSSVDSKSEAL